MRTGCTIERTGVQTNPLTDEQNRLNPKLFQNKIDALDGLDQILVEDYGYLSEYYGKWHIPEKYYYSRNGTSKVIDYNDYDYATDEFMLKNNSWARKLREYLNHFDDKGYIDKTYGPGQQEDTYSRYAYTPITLDSRFGMPTDTPIDDFSSFNKSQNSQMGIYSLASNYTASYFNHDVAMRALNRLATQDKPFVLTVSYHSPHPPYMAPIEYLRYYWGRRSELFLPPTAGIPLDNSISYFSESETEELKNAGFCDGRKIQELTAVYYALVEEIDALVGIMLDRLDELGIADNTMVIYTSDHGEALGANCLRGKSTFFENAAHVPLLIKYPLRIPANTVVDEAVSLIDVFSTILDYTGAAASDTSDGATLRGFIDGSSFNFFHDETAAVSEWDYREPEGDQQLSRNLVSRPNFMVRHREYKLLIHKKTSSTKDDWLFNLDNDPYETINLVEEEGRKTDITIGKAEHLRYLLIEWMRRVQNKGRNDFYSNPIYNVGEGQGDITEIMNRQSWPATDFWVSDFYLVFAKGRRNGANFVRHEWLYIGRRTPGILNITNLSLIGEDAGMFRISKKNAVVDSLGVLRLKVTYADAVQPQESQPVNVFLLIEHDAGQPRYVPLLLPNNFIPNPPTFAPSTSLNPTETPTGEPSEVPTASPTNIPSNIPSRQPSEIPSLLPSSAPTGSPTTTVPSDTPSTSVPTDSSTTLQPSVGPSIAPSRQPSSRPSSLPTAGPTIFEEDLLPSSASNGVFTWTFIFVGAVWSTIILAY